MVLSSVVDPMTMDSLVGTTLDLVTVVPLGNMTLTVYVPLPSPQALASPKC